MRSKPKIKPFARTYLLKDLPPEMWLAAKAKAKAEHVPLRAVILAVLCAWLDGDITVTPGKRRQRRGMRPGRSVHIRQAGKHGEAVIQPHRFNARMARPIPPPAPKPPRVPVAPPAAPEPAQRTFHDAIEKLRARL